MGIGIDGRLHYRVKVLQEWSDDTLMAVLAHEILHLALGHPHRGIGKDRFLFRLASDLVVNDILWDERLSQYLPVGALNPRNHGFQISFLNIKIADIDRKSVEQIYDELARGKVEEKIREYSERKTKKPSMDREEENRRMGIWEDHTWNSPDDLRNASCESADFNENARKSSDAWMRRMIDAEIECRARGDSTSARIREVLRNAFAPRIPWHIYLQEFIEKNVISDFSFRRPRRSSQATGVLLPSVIRENIVVYFHIDSSGSVRKEELTLALSELRYLMNSHPNIKAYVIVSDILISFTDGVSNIPMAFHRLPSDMPRLVVLNGYCDRRIEASLRRCSDVIII